MIEPVNHIECNVVFQYYTCIRGVFISTFINHQLRFSIQQESNFEARNGKIIIIHLLYIWQLLPKWGRSTCLSLIQHTILCDIVFCLMLIKENFISKHLFATRPLQEGMIQVFMAVCLHKLYKLVYYYL